MPLELYKRSDKGSALNANEFDANLTAIENEVNNKASLDGDGKVLPEQLPSMNYIPTSQKGAADGVASLNGDGKVPVAQLPETAPLGVMAREIGGTAYPSLLGIVCPPSLEFKAYDFLGEANGKPPVATFARASSATHMDAAGIIQTSAADELRHDFDPATGEYKGWLIEEQRTNFFLNSFADGTNLSTQGVTVTEQEYTVSFYGAGSITFSGAYSGTLSGAGDFPERVDLTFTPSVGTVTCSVSGEVKYANFEAGSFPTSYIPTTTAAATRAADVLNVDLSNCVTHPNEGTLLVEFVVGRTGGGYRHVAALSDGSWGNQGRLRFSADSSVLESAVYANGGYQAQFQSAPLVTGETCLVALSYGADSFAFSVDGSLQTDVSGDAPVFTKLSIGGSAVDSQQPCLTVKRAMIFPVA